MILSRLPIRNIANEKLIVHVEPWGEQYPLISNELVELVFYGPEGGTPDICVGNSELFVYGWQQSQVFVLKNNLCVAQPSLLSVIEKLSASTQVDRSLLDLEPELIEFSQYQLDKAEAWDDAGKDAARLALNRTVQMFHRVDNDQFVWEFCEKILQSRGVFLADDDTRKQLFLQAVRAQDSVDKLLAEWPEISAGKLSQLNNTAKN